MHKPHTPVLWQWPQEQKLHKKDQDWKEGGGSGDTKTWFQTLVLIAPGCVTGTCFLTREHGDEKPFPHQAHWLLVCLIPFAFQSCQFHLPNISWIAVPLGTILVQVISLLVVCHHLLPSFLILLWLPLLSVCHTAVRIVLQNQIRSSNHPHTPHGACSDPCLFFWLIYFCLTTQFQSHWPPFYFANTWLL